MHDNKSRVSDGIYVPKLYFKQYKSNVIGDFVNRYNKSGFIDLDHLRIMMKNDKKHFEMVKLELLIRGFNIVSTKNSNYFSRPINHYRGKYILNKKEGKLDSLFLHQIGLFNICSKISFFDRNQFNYLSLERLIDLSSRPDTLESFLKNNDFIVEEFNYQEQDEEINNIITIEDNNDYSDILLNLDKKASKKQIRELSSEEYKLSNKLIYRNKILNQSDYNLFLQSTYDNTRLNRRGLNASSFCNKGIPIAYITLLLNTLEYCRDLFKIIFIDNRLGLEYFINKDFSMLDNILDNYYLDELKNNNDKSAKNNCFIYNIGQFNSFLSEFKQNIADLEKEIVELNLNERIELSDFFLDIDFVNSIQNDMLKRIREENTVLSITKRDKLNNFKTNKDVKLINLDYIFSTNLISKDYITLLNRAELTNILDIEDLFLNINKASLISEKGLNNSFFRLDDFLIHLDNVLKGNICNLPVYLENLFIKTGELDNFISDEDYNHEFQSLLKRNKEKKLYTLKMRDIDKTLQDIAEECEVTRESIRQYETKAIKDTKALIIDFLDQKLYEHSALHIDYFKKYYGVKTFLQHNKLNKSYIVLSPYNIVITNEKWIKSKSFIEKIEDSKVSYELLLKIKTMFAIDLFWYYRTHKSYSYKDGYYYNTKNNSKRNIGIDILKKAGKEGLSLNKDKAFIKNEFSKLNIKYSDRNAYVYITDHNESIIKDKSHYVHKDFISKEQKEIVKKLIDTLQGDASAKKIYEENENILKEVGIDNHIFFYGISDLVDINGFNRTGRSMQFVKGKVLEAKDRIENVKKKKNFIFTKKYIIEKLGISEPHLNNLIKDKSILIKFDINNYITKDFITINDNQVYLLREVIEELFKENNGFTSSFRLREKIIFNKTFKNFLKANKIEGKQELQRLSNITSFIFPDLNINPSINIISKSNIKIKSIAELLKIEFKERSFDRDDIVNFLTSNGLGYTQHLNPFLKKQCIMYDDRYYKLKEDVKIEPSLHNIVDFINNEFINEIIITVDNIKTRVLSQGKLLDDKYSQNVVLLNSHLSLLLDCYFKRPEVDFNQPIESLPYLLINTKKVGSIKLSDSIVEFVKANARKLFITYDEINELLIENKILRNELTLSNYYYMFKTNEFYVEVNVL